MASRILLLARGQLAQPLLSLNKFTSGHWSSKNKHWWRTKSIWLPILRSSAGLGIPCFHRDLRRYVRVERWLSKGERKWDKENCLSGDVKCVNDALVMLQWLKDDADKWRELDFDQKNLRELNGHDQYLYHKNVRTIVEIADLG